MKIAALGDIHVRENDHGKWHDLFRKLSDEADLILLCGDLTDTGTLAEAETLATELKACTKPVFAVLGNHDYEHNLHVEIKKLLSNEWVTILDGESAVFEDIGIAGVKGFGGGFGHFMLPRWGEQMNKEFVNETVREALLLDSALAKLDSDNTGLKKLVIMHYAPIQETIEGEPPEIHAFLGCSRLSEPINSRDVTAVFHGHAHSGKLHGKTTAGIDVYNVSIQVLKKEGLEKPYFILDL